MPIGYRLRTTNDLTLIVNLGLVKYVGKHGALSSSMSVKKQPHSDIIVTRAVVVDKPLGDQEESRLIRGLQTTLFVAHVAGRRDLSRCIRRTGFAGYSRATHVTHHLSCLTQFILAYSSQVTEF